MAGADRLELGTQRGRHQDAIRGQGGHHEVGEVAQRGPGLVQDGGFDPVGDHADGLDVVGAELVDGGLGGVPDLFDPALVAADHQQQRAVEIGGDVGVEGQLGRAGHVGVVGTQHDDRVEPGADPAELLDDRLERTLGVGAHLVVADADGIVVVEPDAGLSQQHLKDVVAHPGFHQRAEHPTDSTPRSRVSNRPRATTDLPVCPSGAAT